MTHVQGVVPLVISYLLVSAYQGDPGDQVLIFKKYQTFRNSVPKYQAFSQKIPKIPKFPQIVAYLSVFIITFFYF